MSAHYLNLEGARTINTSWFKLTQLAVAEIVEELAMGAFHGDAGLGKTFAVRYAAARSGVECSWAEFPERPTMRRMVAGILRAVTGVEHDHDRYRLTADLGQVLSERPRLLIVDEAQRLNRDCIETLRHLHDDPGTRFALALVGGNDCWTVLSRYPMLRSRIFARVAFEKMTFEQVLAVIPKFHRIYEHADRNLLALIDDYCAHGNFRDWASFTKRASKLCATQDLPTVTEQVANTAMALQGGGREAA
ncbi:MAG: ATP-binding protein [Actinomycetota bacterium]|nr:ATP-binding protein [Actinomycetota bacterium]